MASHQIDRVRVGALHEPSSIDVPRNRINMPSSQAPSIERNTESRSMPCQEARPSIRPISKASRSLSNDDAVRPSGLPRFAGNISSYRRPSVPTIPTTRPDPPQHASIAPKAKARDTTVTSLDRSNRINERPRNVLRRKANFKRQEQTDRVAPEGQIKDVGTEDIQTIISPLSSHTHHEGGANVPAQDVIPQSNSSINSTKSSRKTTTLPTENTQTRQIPKELMGLRTVINTTNLPPPPTPIFPSASTPSTRYSGSPGMWSSRGSTPTSLSSYSPGITQPANYRFKQHSPIHRRQALGLQTVTTPVSQIDPDEPTMLGSIATDHYANNVRVEINQTRNTEEIRAPIGGPSPEQINPPQNISTQSVDSDSQIGKANLLASPLVGTNASARPRRPSRDGIEQLEQSVSPVIRSNLPALRANISHMRRKSADKAQSPELLRVVPPRSAATSVESLQSNVSNRIPPRNDVETQLPRKAQRTLVKAPKDSRVYNSTNTANKFSLFGKKSKVDLASASSDTVDLTSRKGPAAGTGHEGYGRYAQRGRKPSVSSSGSRARSTSTSGGASINSNKGVNRQDATIDDFLRDRLEPVIINGGGLAHEELFRTQSGQSLSTLSVTSVSSSMVAGGRPVGDWSSESLNSSLDPKKQTGKKFSSETSLPSLVSSDQRIKPKMMRNEIAPAQIPTLESKKRFSTTPAVSRTSEESSFSALPVISKTTSKSDSIGSRGASKSKTSRRWNFFHRSQKKEMEEEIHLPTKEIVPVTQLRAEVASISRARPIAHYAILDVDSDSLEDILHRLEESPPSDNESISKNHQNKSDLALNARHGTSVLLPSPPAILKGFQSEVPSPPRNRPASPKVYFQKEINNPRQEGTRKSRLEPVGRIPRVVSRRERDHKPSPQSYSRPFCRDEAPSLTITAGPPTALRDLESDQSKLYLQMDPFQQGPFYKVPGASGASSALVSSESANFMSVAYSTNEFLRFSPRKPSEASTSTSEGDSILATVAAMGLKPQTGLEEEDIWAEYDDLLDTMLAPKQASQPKTISSFELAKKASKTLQAEISASNLTQRVSTASDTPSLAVTDAKSPDRSSDASTRLRRSKISAALHSSVSPSPQASYSELIAGYSERNKSLSDFIPPDSHAKLQEDQVQTQEEELQILTPANTPDFETTRRRNTILFDMAERMREGATAQTNLRSASLMTSRWLSFGRVLFSPAHNRIQKNESECILILDGLGNDDWSYYCALTYPGAHIYNLSIRSGSSSSSPHPDAWKPPSNHHHVHHIGNKTAFPFPKGFFSVCVLRFPAASSEDRQRHILSECKRVLRPGGYLETSILDLDLVNVGSRTRKAVRSLKEKIYQADPDISLKPASDNIQRLLGICGYDNLNRCMVSIPVAGMIGGSTASSSSTNTLSDLPSADTGTSPQPSLTASSLRPHAHTPSDDTEPSLGDLLSDPSPSATNDQSITKVVAKVGRWWYTRCYEIPVLSDPSTDKSIWSEQRILRECQKRGTGFRLLIAYAQKPSEKRRTVSF